MLETYILNINKKIEKHDFNRLMLYVSEEKRQRICRFRQFEDANRTLLGDVLARYAICKRLQVKNSNLVFSVNEYGKPLLIEPFGIHFNISHSGDFVICVLDDKPIGVDVELIRPIDIKIAKKFFTEEEYLSILSKPEDLSTQYFFTLWTLKEAYIKAEGKGMSIDLNSFTVNTDGKKISLIEKGSSIDKNYNFYQYFLDSNTVYAVCTLSEDLDNRSVFDINYFLKQIVNKHDF